MHPWLGQDLPACTGPLSAQPEPFTFPGRSSPADVGGGRLAHCPTVWSDEEEGVVGAEHARAPGCHPPGARPCCGHFALRRARARRAAVARTGGVEEQPWGCLSSVRAGGRGHDDHVDRRVRGSQQEIVVVQDPARGRGRSLSPDRGPRAIPGVHLLERGVWASGDSVGTICLGRCRADFMLGVFTWTDEVTSVCHLFYRERLAKAFVGYRKLANDEAPLLNHKQPPWKHRIRFSGVNFGSSDHARLPNLVVCAAANLSRDLPAGRFGASFTFEKDRCGGPSTGYVPTSWFEEEAGEATSTLPALMAVSGAAIAPSMGKMTRPFLRFLMAMFNLRLGVWLPNPRQAEHEGSKIALSAADLREGRKFDTEGGEFPVTHGLRRPGALYILREALRHQRPRPKLRVRHRRRALGELGPG